MFICAFLKISLVLHTVRVPCCNDRISVKLITFMGKRSRFCNAIIEKNRHDEIGFETAKERGL